MHRSLIIGLRGRQLEAEERHWLCERPPLGIILFARNIHSAGQVQALLAEVREATGQATWAAIDEEGGRVNRLPWEPFSGRRHAAEYGEMFRADPGAARQAVFDDNRRVGEALAGLGFTHNCAPDLDVFHPDGHGIIGRRAYSGDAAVVAELGAACLRGLAAAGIEAVGKHFPGHGRANADSHVAIPEADAPLATLLAEAEPFRRLIDAELAHIMTAHVIYPQVERQVATLSPFWLNDVLRRRFGFAGRIWSDDLCMKGVGTSVSGAARQALAAGCDTLLVCEPDGAAEIYGAMEHP
ncbi:MAG TPA: beta-N-acetylhexosaminidase [Mariprofundaceae bacterium]|nr:beta-N-acetylhexosaminidase [Mariprofundaceae bacterium]